MTEQTPAEVFPPGEFLRDELEARGWTQSEFAEILGRPHRVVNEIIQGRRAITPATAKELAAALGTSPQFWLNLESAYRLNRSAPPPKRIAIEARLREKYPVREMIKRGWIEASENPEVLQAQVLEFFKVSSLEEDATLPCAAKKATPGNFTALQLAWVHRVAQMARAVQVGRYSEIELRNALSRLHTLMGAPDEVRHVPRILAECGVRLVIVEPLPGARIDGVCMWLDESPAIGLSLRLDRIDNFWFVLRHEIEHVLRGDGKDVPVVDDEIEVGAPNTSSQADPREIAANVAAAEFCVPQDKLNDFITRVHPIYSDVRLIGFASLLQIHPGIVVGQIQRRTNRYDLFRKYLAKVRDYLVPNAISDGYGRTNTVAF